MAWGRLGGCTWNTAILSLIGCSGPSDQDHKPLLQAALLEYNAVFLLVGQSKASPGICSHLPYESLTRCLGLSHSNLTEDVLSLIKEDMAIPLPPEPSNVYLQEQESIHGISSRWQNVKLAKEHQYLMTMVFKLLFWVRVINLGVISVELKVIWLNEIP